MSASDAISPTYPPGLDPAYNHAKPDPTSSAPYKDIVFMGDCIKETKVINYPDTYDQYGNLAWLTFKQPLPNWNFGATLLGIEGYEGTNGSYSQYGGHSIYLICGKVDEQGGWPHGTM
jgi:hypothetical protein